jgi:L-amino acid N-acyltransferase YncA
MSDSLEQGLLKTVELNGKRIGLIVGEKSDFLGRTGIYFHEIYISSDWKGMGLAKAIQRKYISLFANELELIWGTIDSANLPSYKTAYSNGRRAVRYECFVKL